MALMVPLAPLALTVPPTVSVPPVPVFRVIPVPLMVPPATLMEPPAPVAVRFKVVFAVIELVVVRLPAAIKAMEPPLETPLPVKALVSIRLTEAVVLKVTLGVANPLKLIEPVALASPKTTAVVPVTVPIPLMFPAPVGSIVTVPAFTEPPTVIGPPAPVNAIDDPVAVMEPLTEMVLELLVVFNVTGPDDVMALLIVIPLLSVKFRPAVPIVELPFAVNAVVSVNVAPPAPPPVWLTVKLGVARLLSVITPVCELRTADVPALIAALPLIVLLPVVLSETVFPLSAAPMAMLPCETKATFPAVALIVPVVLIPALSIKLKPPLPEVEAPFAVRAVVSVSDTLLAPPSVAVTFGVARVRLIVPIPVLAVTDVLPLIVPAPPSEPEPVPVKLTEVPLTVAPTAIDVLAPVPVSEIGPVEVIVELVVIPALSLRLNPPEPAVETPLPVRATLSTRVTLPLPVVVTFGVAIFKLPMLPVPAVSTSAEVAVTVPDDCPIELAPDVLKSRVAALTFPLRLMPPAPVRLVVPVPEMTSLVTEPPTLTVRL